MNTPQTSPFVHSADVRIHLYVNGSVLPVGQLGPNFLMLRIPVDYPPCDAEIAMSIDGHESRWAVHLPNGIHASRPETAIAPRAADKGTAQNQIGHGVGAVESGQPTLPS